MFENFNITKQANKHPILDKDSSSILEGRSKSLTAQGFNSYPQVFQICTTCNSGMLHYILEETVTCIGCKNSYKLK